MTSFDYTGILTQAVDELLPTANLIKDCFINTKTETLCLPLNHYIKL